MSFIEESLRFSEKFYPNFVAVDAGERRITYAELAGLVDRLCQTLERAGVKSGDIVALHLSDAFALIPLVLAIFRMGGVFAPLDPAIPIGRLRTLVAELDPAFILVSAESSLKPFDTVLTDACTALDSLEGIQLIKRQILQGQWTLPLLNSDRAMYVFFTSGSTGKPKGIVGRLSSVDHFIQWEIATLKVGSQTRVSQFTSPSFDAVLRDWFTPLCAGGTICIPQRDIVLSAPKLVSWIARQGIELIHCVPSLFRFILAQDLRHDCFPALRSIVLAGEALPPADVRRWFDIFGSRIELINLYGPSETTMTKFFHFVRREDAERRSIPIGKPISGARAIVADGKGHPIPPGGIGEIYIRTRFCSLGYLRRPDLTNEAFFRAPNSNDPADLVYKTGDFGRVLGDGTFELLGRRDNQVKVNGIRVELGEIESILRECVIVKDVVVVDRTDGSGQTTLWAYVVLSDPNFLKALVDFATAELPSYILPRFILMTGIPRTITGKVDRRALPTTLEDCGGQRRVGASVTPLEEIVRDLWCKMLKVPDVSTEASFFSLGGHSLLVIEMLARFTDILQIDVPLELFLAQPTVSGLCSIAETGALSSLKRSPPPLKRANRDQPLVLSHAQHRLWVTSHFKPQQVANNIGAAFRLTGSFNRTTLEKSIGCIISRHEILRTKFVLVGDQPRQLIVPDIDVSIRKHDLRNLPQGLRAAEVERAALADFRLPFDLCDPPLFRATLLQTENDEHLLVLTMHHIISDTQSVDVFVNEMLEHYSILDEGGARKLNELPVQYADFAAWLREWYDSHLLEGSLAYWRRTLAQLPEVHSLPSDFPRSPERSFQGAHQHFDLDSGLTASLQRLGSAHDTTLFVLLLGALKTLLFRFGGQSDLPIGVPISNRTRAELKGLIGFFSDVIVIRAPITSELPFATALKGLHNEFFASYRHRHVPFEKLVEVAGHGRDSSYAPLVQIMFSFEERELERPKSVSFEISEVELETGTSHFDLFFAIKRSPEGLHGVMEYDTGLYSAEFAATLVRSFQTLLASIVAEPDGLIGRLALLSQRERDQLLGGAQLAQANDRSISVD